VITSLTEDQATAVGSAPAKMKAAVYVGNHTVDVCEIDTPRIGPGELLVRVEACGICHTDLKKIEHDLLPVLVFSAMRRPALSSAPAKA